MDLNAITPFTQISSLVVIVIGLVVFVIKMMSAYHDRRNIQVSQQVSDLAQEMKASIGDMRGDIKAVDGEMRGISRDINEIKCSMQQYVTRSEFTRTIERVHKRIDDTLAGNMSQQGENA